MESCNSDLTAVMSLTLSLAHGASGGRHCPPKKNKRSMQAASEKRSSTLGRKLRAQSPSESWEGVSVCKRACILLVAALIQLPQGCEVLQILPQTRPVTPQTPQKVYVPYQGSPAVFCSSRLGWPDDTTEGRRTIRAA